MLYVSCKVGDKFKVYDTEDNSSSIYTYNELWDLYDGNVKVKGCAKVGGMFTVTPVPFVYGKGKEGVAKSLLINGNTSGVQGLNLEIKDDGSVVFSLDKEFYKYAKENSMNGRYVLTIPDIVTNLSEHCFGWFNVYYEDGDTDILFHIDVPDSLRSITSGLSLFLGLNLHSGDIIYRIDSIEWDNSLDSIEGYGSYNSCGIYCFDKESIELNINHLGTGSINLDGVDKLYLPTVQTMGDCSISSDFGSFDDIQIFLGRGIKTINDFAVNESLRYSKLTDTCSLAPHSVVVHLEDGCSINTIDFSYSDNISDPYVHPYIFIISDTEKARFFSRIDSGELRVNFGDHPLSTLGIISYRSIEDLGIIEKNIWSYLKRSSDYLSRDLLKADIGKIINLGQLILNT